MSEQEKMAAITAEGTVTEAKERKGFFTRLKEKAAAHPTAVKWVKRIGIGLGWGGTAVLAFMAGRGGNVAPINLPEASAEEAEEMDMDEE